MENINFFNSTHKIPEGKKLYKYFRNLDYAETSIKTKTLHFEKLNTYNDIFDGGFAQDFNTIQKYSNENNQAFKLFMSALETTEYITYTPEIEKKSTDYLKNCDNLKEVIEKAAIYIEQSCKIKIKNIFSDTVLENILKILGGEKIKYPDNISCACFSEVNDSLLMWGYYTNNHNGICLEYELHHTNEIVNNINRVAYSANRYNLFEDINSLITKSIEWSHEQEWRVICEMEDKESLPFPYIAAIYLGARISEEDEKRFVKLGKEYNLKVYKMIPSLSKYEIEPHEIKL